ncbi:interleukin-8-like [Rhinatrema bivittatum]|uniref:interleukin-8-like n=1 Tax=Rhinatrema bivittatum TaxID=194408 RepID=UPI0011296E5A|nr:interleukin-8-like [Rhinatrema bivittatum]
MLVKLIVLALMGLSLVAGGPITMDGARCLCYKTVSKITFHPKQVKNIEILPQTASCENVEIIVNLKNNRRFCLDPNEDKIKNIFHQLINKKKNEKN